MLQLDAQQKAVVTSEAKNILVVAGAGSGKTRVLTERIKWLLHNGVQPSNIVAITFTNMAADEMKARLKEVNTIGDAFIGTIHSFANRIYKNSGETYRIMTEQEEQLIYEEICNMPKYNALKIKRWLQFMDLRKQADAGRIDERQAWEFLNPSERNVLYTSKGDFERIRKRDNLITFDELLNFATSYYESLGASIEHLLVDEFQDIGSLEYKFIKALNAEHYFFVGDDYQAIYGFKGGNDEFFKNICNRDKAFQTYFLNNNYRSCKEVIDMGEKVIAQVPDRIRKRAVAINKTPGRVEICAKDRTSKLTSLLKEDEDNWRDWFVLTRTNKEAYTLADLFDDEGINYCFITRSELTLEELQEALQKNLVKIMTVHASKGLENKKVILYGRFPVQQPPYMRNPEERKVMYVGVTRAIESLYIFN
jgi:DNA helicase-2/ATP-dependent DNA helicase PcrA